MSYSTCLINCQEEIKIKIRLSSRAIDTLIDHATEGYERDFKSEVGGHLIGFENRYGFYVDEAVPYDTPRRSRTWWGPNWKGFTNRGYDLEATKFEWIGVYHSHPEVGGKASTLLSPEDERAIRFFGRPVEVIVRVSEFTMNAPKDCLPFEDEENGFSFDICGYLWDSRDRIRRIKVVES